MTKLTKAVGNFDEVFGVWKGRLDIKDSGKWVRNLRKKISFGLLFLDGLIAATCIIRKNILVTQNIKDFRFISGLEVLSQKEAFATS